MDNEEKMGPMQWEEHCIYLVCSLAELYKNSEFIDCELDTEGGLLRGHRAILAACSPYLKKLLLEHEGRRTVPLKQVKYKDMKYILDFIYYGEVGVPVAGMASLMETANFLKISSLRSCLSPNAFRKILSEVPVGQHVRGSGSKSNADLSKNCEPSLQILENMTNNDLEEISCRVNNSEIQANVPRIRVIDKELMKQFGQVAASEYVVADELETATESSGEKFTCEECNMSFSTVSHFKNHKQMHMAGKRLRFSCMVCDRKFTRMIHLKQHVRVHSEKIFTCAVCNKDFKQHSSLKQHMNEHTEKKFTCDVCDSSFSRLPYLRVHMNIHLGKKFPCKICNKVLSSNPSRHRHMRIHSGKKISCDMCDKTFTRICGLKDHIRISHVGEKITCEVCNKNFSTLTYLKEHQRVHWGEKFSCELCNKNFARASCLKSHMRIHTGERFSCEVCNKHFSRLSYLEEHKQTHSGEKITCEVCKKSFTRILSLQRHMHKHS